MKIKETVCGFLMALADSVPGVSGGTVAFAAGIYDRFISAFGDLFDKSSRSSAAVFLLKLGIGWIVGMAISVRLLAGLFTDHVYETSSLFLGLVFASVPLIIVKEKETLKKFRAVHLLCGVLGAAAVVLLCGVRLNFSVEPLTVPTALYVFVGGVLAISAMVLPGISGSTLLLALGLYLPIIGGIKKLLAFDLSGFPLLCVFGAGVLLGVAVTFKALKDLLEKHRAAMLFTIIGLMLGSLYAVVNGPATLSEPKPPMSLAFFAPLYFVIGAAIVAVFAVFEYVIRNAAAKEGARS